MISPKKLFEYKKDIEVLAMIEAQPHTRKTQTFSVGRLKDITQK